MTDLPPELEALFRKALKAAHRKGLKAGEAKVLAGLRAVAELNGSAPDLLRPVRKALPPARHPLDVIGDAVLEVLGVEAKAFDESKHPRDHGQFASEPGAEGEPEESAPSHPKAVAAARRIAQHIGTIAARLNAAVLSAGLTPEDVIGSQEDWLRIWTTHHADVVAHALGVDAMTAAHILTHLATRAIGLAKEHLGWGRVEKAFDESKVKRGQPENAGEFAPKGGGTWGKKADKKPAKPAQKPPAKAKPDAPKANTPEGDSGEQDPAANRPSKPSERHPGAKPEPLPWRDPPPKKAVQKGAGKATRPTGDQSQTKLGDQAEELARALGMRSILPPGQRSHKPGENKDKGSTIDLEFDHSGRAYELKMCNVEATEYRLKAKASEKEAKLKFAKLNKLTPYTLVGVRDGDAGEVHFYAAREPGMVGAEVSPAKFDYLGTVKIGGK